MPTISVGKTLSGAGSSISRVVGRTVDGTGNREVTLAAGKAGTLTTRTDNDTGTITMSSGGHGITTAQVVDVFWSGGMRYGVTVGTVSGTSVPIDLGAGDNLPSATTAVVVSPRTQVNAAIDGDNLSVLGIEAGYADSASTAQAHAEFQDAASDMIAELDLTANSPRVYDISGGDANPFTGDPITKFYASNGSSSAAATLKLIWGEDTTP